MSLKRKHIYDLACLLIVEYLKDEPIASFFVLKFEDSGHLWGVRSCVSETKCTVVLLVIENP